MTKNNKSFFAGLFVWLALSLSMVYPMGKNWVINQTHAQDNTVALEAETGASHDT